MLVFSVFQMFFRPFQLSDILSQKEAKSNWWVVYNISNQQALQSNLMQSNRSRSRSGSETSDRGNNSNFTQPNRRLFIAGFPSEAEDADIKNMFEGVGSVLDFFIKRQETGNCFGFVEMGSLEEAETAINKINGKRIGSRMMKVYYAKPKQNRAGGRQGNSDRPSGGFRGQRQGGFKPREEGGQRRFESNRNENGQQRQQDNRNRFNNSNNNDRFSGNSNSNNNRNGGYDNPNRKEFGGRGGELNGRNNGEQGRGREQVQTKTVENDEHDY